MKVNDPCSFSATSAVASMTSKMQAGTGIRTMNAALRVRYVLYLLNYQFN